MRCEEVARCTPCGVLSAVLNSLGFFGHSERQKTLNRAMPSFNERFRDLLLLNFYIILPELALQ